MSDEIEKLWNQKSQKIEDKVFPLSIHGSLEQLDAVEEGLRNLHQSLRTVTRSVLPDFIPPAKPSWRVPSPSAYLLAQKDGDANTNFKVPRIVRRESPTELVIDGIRIARGNIPSNSQLFALGTGLAALHAAPPSRPQPFKRNNRWHYASDRFNTASLTHVNRVWMYFQKRRSNKSASAHKNSEWGPLQLDGFEAMAGASQGGYYTDDLLYSQALEGPYLGWPSDNWLPLSHNFFSVYQNQNQNDTSLKQFNAAIPVRALRGNHAWGKYFIKYRLTPELDHLRDLSGRLLCASSTSAPVTVYAKISEYSIAIQQRLQSLLIKTGWENTVSNPPPQVVEEDFIDLQAFDLDNDYDPDFDDEFDPSRLHYYNDDLAAFLDHQSSPRHASLIHGNLHMMQLNGNEMSGDEADAQHRQALRKLLESGSVIFDEDGKTVWLSGGQSVSYGDREVDLASLETSLRTLNISHYSGTERHPGKAHMDIIMQAYKTAWAPSPAYPIKRHIYAMYYYLHAFNALVASTLNDDSRIDFDVLDQALDEIHHGISVGCDAIDFVCDESKKEMAYQDKLSSEIQEMDERQVAAKRKAENIISSGSKSLLSHFQAPPRTWDDPKSIYAQPRPPDDDRLYLRRLLRQNRMTDWDQSRFVLSVKDTMETTSGVFGTQIVPASDAPLNDDASKNMNPPNLLASLFPTLNLSSDTKRKHSTKKTSQRRKPFQVAKCQHISPVAIGHPFALTTEDRSTSVVVPAASHGSMLSMALLMVFPALLVPFSHLILLPRQKKGGMS